MKSSTIIVAYDPTPNGQDALALGSLLSATSGAALAVAHVYPWTQHGSPSADSADGRERFLRGRAEELLARAAESVDRDVRRIPLASPTTASGITELVEREHAGLVIFGSAERTPHGRVRPGSASRRLLQGLHGAVAFAPVGFHELRSPALDVLSVTLDESSAAARRSAESLAHSSGGRLAEPHDHDADVLFVGSRPGAAHGQVMTGTRADEAIRRASSPVIVVPCGEPLELVPASVSIAA
jgi:nucleotide-binding universal stress UspA family protein